MKRTALKKSPAPQRKTRLRSAAKGTYWKKALDALARKIVFARDPVCQRCGRADQGQWCHVNSRRYLSSRWRLENSLRLCSGCHLLWHHRPIEAVRWFGDKFPERLVWTVFRPGGKFDRKLEKLYLIQEAQRYGVEP